MAPKGNKNAVGNKGGAPLTWKKPYILWNDALAYFKWAEENPLVTQKASVTNGEVTKYELNLMRALTIEGFARWSCEHNNKRSFHSETYRNYSLKPEFFGVTKKIGDYITGYDIEGASANLLNANIIARKLKLKDSYEHTGEDGGSIKHDVTTHVGLPETDALFERIKADRPDTAP